MDQGAVNALQRQGKSLLSAGITNIGKSFERGDTISILDGANQEFARGITAYARNELAQIKGHHSEQITATLGCLLYTSPSPRDS